jgi:peptide/nickel transport system substrate-binding protein
VLELAKSVTPSEDGLTYTYKLRDDAYFHNGRKMTADDIIWSYTRIMDGSKGYPGARYVRIIKGAVDVEKGQATAISGLKKIDDFTLEMTLTDRVDPGMYFYNGNTAIYPAGEADKPEFLQKPIGLGPSVRRASRVAPRQRWEKFTSPACPTRTGGHRHHGRSPARDIAFRNKEIDLSSSGRRVAIMRSEPEDGILEVAEVFTHTWE